MTRVQVNTSNSCRNCLPEMIGLSQPGHGVDEPGGHVQPESPLTGAVVVGEGVVVIVEALTPGQQGYQSRRHSKDDWRPEKHLFSEGPMFLS